MKTIQKISLALSLIVLAGCVVNAASMLHDDFLVRSSANDKTSFKNFTPLIEYNGKLIPLVELPMVTIHAEGNYEMYTKNISRTSLEKTKFSELCVRAISYNGSLIPLIILPEVTIVAENDIHLGMNDVKGFNPIMTSGNNAQGYLINAYGRIVVATYYKGKYIPMVDLPIVEIIGNKYDDETDNIAIEAKEFSIKSNERGKNKIYGKISIVSNMLFANFFKRWNK